MGLTLISEKEVDQSIWFITILNLPAWLSRRFEPLSQPISWRVIRGAQDVFDVVFLHEILKLLWGELWTIIWDNLLRQSILCCKQHSLHWLTHSAIIGNIFQTPNPDATHNALQLLSFYHYLLRHNHSYATQDTVTFNSEFMSPFQYGLRQPFTPWSQPDLVKHLTLLSSGSCWVTFPSCSGKRTNL